MISPYRNAISHAPRRHKPTPDDPFSRRAARPAARRRQGKSSSQADRNHDLQLRGDCQAHGRALHNHFALDDNHQMAAPAVRAPFDRHRAALAGELEAAPPHAEQPSLRAGRALGARARGEPGRRFRQAARGARASQADQARRAPAQSAAPADRGGGSPGPPGRARTRDRGPARNGVDIARAPSEALADHKRFSMETDIDVYFCDPQSPWQRGSSENTNRLLRQYFPKGLDLAAHSQAELNKVARQLNERPRKTLDFQSPAERFSQCVAATG